MNNKLYNDILCSINREIKNVINEQFNIGNMNLNSNERKHKNIFNKNAVDPQYIFDKIIKREDVNDDEIESLNYIVSAVRPDGVKQLRNIIYFYSRKYNNESLNWLDVSGISDMSDLFTLFCGPYNGDISQWDVSNVTKMTKMFSFSYFNGDISQWDVSNVQDMRSMFECSHFTGDISKWDVSNVQDMQRMFYSSDFNGDISNWDVSAVGSMNGMFFGSKFEGDISQWNVSNVRSMQYMFNGTKFNGDISKWDVSNVLDMSFMFAGSNEIYNPFNQDISEWDTSNTQRMTCMFQNSKFNQDISGWNTSSVINHYKMFNNCLILEKYKPKFKSTL